MNSENLSVLFESREQVDDWAKEVEKAGEKIVSKPEIFEKGYYSFVFAEPEGHKFICREF